MDSSFDITAMAKKLNELGDKFAKQSTRHALRAGAKVFQQRLVTDAPVKSGMTRKAVKVRAMKRKKNRIGMMVSISKSSFTGDAFYAGFVNYGHVQSRRRRRRLRGKARSAEPEQLGEGEKKIEGTHWMERAWRSVKSSALSAIHQDLHNSLETLAKK